MVKKWARGEKLILASIIIAIVIGFPSFIIGLLSFMKVVGNNYVLSSSELTIVGMVFILLFFIFWAKLSLSESKHPASSLLDPHIIDDIDGKNDGILSERSLPSL